MIFVDTLKHVYELLLIYWTFLFNLNSFRTRILLHFDFDLTTTFHLHLYTSINVNVFFLNKYQTFACKINHIPLTAPKSTTTLCKLALVKAWQMPTEYMATLWIVFTNSCWQLTIEINIIWFKIHYWLCIYVCCNNTLLFVRVKTSTRCVFFCQFILSFFYWYTYLQWVDSRVSKNMKTKMNELYLPNWLI